MQDSSAVLRALSASSSLQAAVTLGAALLSALLGVLGGWLAAYVKVKGERFATREEFDRALEELRRNTEAVEMVRHSMGERVRRTDQTVHYLSQQIEEFYGPLFNLSEQIRLANHVQSELFKADSASDGVLSEEQRGEIKHFFQEGYFFPLHHQINEILKTKLHLVHGSRLPDSFYWYLRHALQEEAQAKLWWEKQIGTDFLRGDHFPNQFFDDVRQGLQTVLAEYQRLISLEQPQGDSRAPAT